MTDSSGDEVEGPDEIALAVEGLADRPDPTLRLLVNLANRAGLVLGVTLTVGGRVITGNLVSFQDFYTALAEQIDGARDQPGNDESGADLLSDYFRNAAEAAREEIREGTAGSLLPSHIHLLDARVFDGSHRETTMGPWRGRLIAVDGWSLGQLRS